MHNNQDHVTRRQQAVFGDLHCCTTDYGWNDQFYESFSVRLQMICSIWLLVGLLFHCVHCHLNIPRPADARAWARVARVLVTPLIIILWISPKKVIQVITYSVFSKSILLFSKISYFPNCHKDYSVFCRLLLSKKLFRFSCCTSSSELICLILSSVHVGVIFVWCFSASSRPQGIMLELKPLNIPELFWNRGE